MGRYAKLFGSLFGAITPAGLVGFLAAFGVEMTPEMAGSLLAALATIGGIIGTYIAPANREPEPTGKHSAEVVAKQAEPAAEAKASGKSALNFADLVADGDPKPLAERETTVTKDGIVVFK